VVTFPELFFIVQSLPAETIVCLAIGYEKKLLFRSSMMDKENDTTLEGDGKDVATAADAPVEHPGQPATSIPDDPQDEVTREIRNPAFGPDVTSPESATPSSPFEHIQAPQPAVELPHVITSKNILTLPVPVPRHDTQTGSRPRTRSRPRARRTGLYVILAIIVVGTTVDLYLWMATGGGRQAAVATVDAGAPLKAVKPMVGTAVHDHAQAANPAGNRQGDKPVSSPQPEQAAKPKRRP
jgi:hypothetical protein